jgi:AcrR family transcriptional regulator
MVNPSLTTEEKIMVAAKVIFHLRGFEGARMQEIADEAGVNKALLHYYYRNKETLFKAVFEDAFTQMIGRLNDIFHSEIPIEEKLTTFLEYYIDFLSRNSYLPMFILQGLYSRPDQLKALLESRKLVPKKLLGHLREQIKREKNLDLDPFHFYINILALCIFPVLAKPVIQTIFELNDEEMQRFFSDRKKVVPEFFMHALKSYENQAKNSSHD